MQITVRKIENTDHLYMAVFKTTLLQGIFSVVFEDNIFGMLSLNQFMEMIRNKFKNDAMELVLEKDLDIKDKNLFDFILKHFNTQEKSDHKHPKQAILFD